MDFAGGRDNTEWKKMAKRPHDAELSELGLKQARALGERLSGTGISHVFCSPFLRTVQTAHAVADRIDAPLLIEDGFCEWLNPEWFSSKPELLLPHVLRRTTRESMTRTSHWVVGHFPS